MSLDKEVPGFIYMVDEPSTKVVTMNELPNKESGS